jgi:hypothetical protein
VEADIAGLVAHFQTVEASISTEISDRGVAITAEESSRIAGDSSLESKVNADISTEKAGRESADASIESYFQEEVDELGDSIYGLGVAMESKDASLEAKVSTEKGRIDAILSAATADSDSFAEIVTLINSVDTENDQAFASYVLSNNAAVSAEESSRLSADSSLESKVNDDVKVLEDEATEDRAASQSADASLEAKVNADVSTEKAGRESADASLEAKVNADVSTEKAGRESADASLELRLSIEESTHAVEYSTEVAAREAAITAEASSRIAGDASLEGKVNADISTEKAGRESADSSLVIHH